MSPGGKTPRLPRRDRLWQHVAWAPSTESYGLYRFEHNIGSVFYSHVSFPSRGVPCPKLYPAPGAQKKPKLRGSGLLRSRQKYDAWFPPTGGESWQLCHTSGALTKKFSPRRHSRRQQSPAQQNQRARLRNRRPKTRIADLGKFVPSPVPQNRGIAPIAASPAWLVQAQVRLAQPRHREHD